ncbi:hypothetical protein CEXT_639901 [Caerostris extrusa]|uniref:Uncharacterized protein n=1 Tax=Caerostris extrusa TaxID=172846 RepID=A0AAV4Y020_CAEEX|nr:hypothetical protein CEXT_639901 [Caerostris extrusa]
MATSVFMLLYRIHIWPNTLWGCYIAPRINANYALYKQYTKREFFCAPPLKLNGLMANDSLGHQTANRDISDKKWDVAVTTESVD